MHRPSKRFPRRRAGADAPAGDSRPSTQDAPAGVPASGSAFDPVALLGQFAPMEGPAVQDEAPSSRVVGLSPQWQARIAGIAETAGLSEAQVAEIHRLASEQQVRISKEIPRLINELKPHFDTPQEAEAKQHCENGMRALKQQMDEETNALFKRFGVDERLL